MLITIKRNRKKTETIDGQVYIEGMRVCDCAENAISALKAGTYTIAIVKCKQHARKMPVICIHKDIKPSCANCPELECVSNNTTMPVFCPQIKAGNGVYHREDGSIIVGKYIAPGCLSHPKSAFDAIYERIRKNVERGNPITLTIVEDYPPSHRELTNFELGQQILQQMGGRKTAIEHTTPLKPSNR